MNYKTYNPAKQNERHIEYLRENFPIIASKAKALHSIVVFVDFSKLKLRNNHGNIGTLWQLPRMIQRFSTPSLSKKDCDAIVKEIEFYNRRKR